MRHLAAEEVPLGQRGEGRLAVGGLLRRVPEDVLRVLRGMAGGCWRSQRGSTLTCQNDSRRGVSGGWLRARRFTVPCQGTNVSFWRREGASNFDPKTVWSTRKVVPGARNGSLWLAARELGGGRAVAEEARVGEGFPGQPGRDSGAIEARGRPGGVEGGCGWVQWGGEPG